MRNRTYLIVGGDSQIGGRLGDVIRNKGGRVITTTKRMQDVSRNNIYLDLNGDVSFWQVPKGIDVVFLCAAVTSIDKCEQQAEETALINVKNTASLASLFAETGAAVVFPSTNLVFDGSDGLKRPGDDRSPVTEYGRQKALAETILSGICERVSILRITKVLEPGMQLVNEWVERLRNGESITAFSDMSLSPVSIDDVATVMLRLAEKGQYGIWHLSGAEQVTYEQLARHIAMRVGADLNLVRGAKAIECGVCPQQLGDYVTLDGSDTEKRLGIEIAGVWETVDSVFGRLY